MINLGVTSMSFRKFYFLFFCLISATALLTACSTVDNNNRDTRELATYMINATGGVWDGPWEVRPLHAVEGFALRIGDRQVVFVKYDNTKKKMKKKLDYVDEHGYLYIAAFRIPAIRHGSFVMLDYEGFPEKIRKNLLDSFKAF